MNPSLVLMTDECTPWFFPHPPFLIFKLFNSVFTNPRSGIFLNHFPPPDLMIYGFWITRKQNEKSSSNKRQKEEGKKARYYLIKDEIFSDVTTDGG